jgi:glucosamine--fructose-6-phosphate aminotransferase (isomerizing)
MLANTNLYREINQQPAALSELLAAEKKNFVNLAQAIRQRDLSHVIIAARGTSDNAARYAQYVLGAINGLTVSLATPSLFTIYRQVPKFGNALVIGISQSGKSPDIVAVLEEAKQQGALTAVFTNTTDSDLASHGDFVIDLHAGAEHSIAATKTYMTSLGSVAMLSAALSSDPQHAAALEQLPSVLETTLSMNDRVAQIAPRYRYMKYCVVIGRGFNYATAFEMALKIKELTYTIVAPYSSADFLHGPMALVERGFPVFVIAPSGVLLTEMKDFIAKLNELQAETIVISDDEQMISEARIPLQLPQIVPEWLSPMAAIVPGQLFALHLAAARDLDVDAPRGLRKVTETR